MIELGLSADVLDTALVSRFLSASLPEGDRLRVMTARLLAHSPGKRTVVAYQTARGEEPGPDLVGKAYADLARAERSQAALAELHALSSNTWGVPRPLALIAELRMSLREAANGSAIDALHGDERMRALALAGRWLSTLHGLDISSERTVRPSSEARKLTEWAQLISEAQPSRAERAWQLSERLQARVAPAQPPVSVLIHKDYHYQHVLFASDHVTVIDLDEVRRGEAALDVGHFCAYLRLLAFREDLAAADAWRFEKAFLGAYAAETGYAPGERHRFYYAYACLKIAKQLVRERGPEPVPAGSGLHAELAFILDEGLQCATD